VNGKNNLSVDRPPLSVVRSRILSNGWMYKMQRTTDNGQRTKGFTLLELMIVLFIIVILAAVTLPQFQKSVLKARETVLKDNLHTMRRMINQYSADKGKLPQELNDLVTEGYLRELPIDPMTDNNEWDVKRDTDVNSLDNEQGIVDVFSKSTDTASDGKTYNEW
jgi:general secretion pathway protein G